VNFNMTIVSVGHWQKQLRASSRLRAVIGFLAILLFYTALTVLFFWHVLPQLESNLIGPPSDNMQDLWNSWYFAAGHGPDFFNTNLIKFPEGTSLYYHDFAYPNLIAVRVLSSVFGTELPTLIILQNFLLLVSFPLAGTGAFYLVRHFVGNTAAALLGGFIFAFNPSHVEHVLGHIGISSIEFIAFFILFYLKALERRRALDISAAIIFYVLSALSCWYYLFYIAYFIVFHTAYLSFRNRALPRGWDVICPSLTVAGTVILLSPLLVPMVMEAVQGMSVNAGGHNTYVADLAAYLAFPPAHMLSGVSEWVNRRFTGTIWDVTVYLGLVNVALLAWAKARPHATGSDTRLLDYALWGIAVFCVLASGATLHVLGHSTVPLPDAVLAFVPFFRNARVPARVIVLVYVFMAIGVAYAYEILWQVWQPHRFRTWAAAAAVALLVLFDFYPANLPTSAITCSPGWAVIRDDPDKNFGILDLPGGYNEGNFDMALQVCHGRPIAQGCISREIVQTLRDRLETADMLAQQAQLTANNIKYIILHREQLTGNKMKYVDLHFDVDLYNLYRWRPTDGDMSRYLQIYPSIYEDNELTILKVY
jgi:hypothetical protein